MTNPVPWLRAGVGETPADGGCIMQVVDWIHSGGWTDKPGCVHPALRAVAIRVNDTLDDGGRQRLLDLAPRLMGTNTGGRDVSVGLAVYAARSVLHVYEDRYPRDDRPRKAIEAAESGNSNAAAAAYDAAHAAQAAADIAAHAAADAAQAAARAAAHAAQAAKNGAARAAADAAQAAARAAADIAAHAAADIAAHAAYAAESACAAAPWGLLVGLLDEYDRLTGRTHTPGLDYRGLCEVMG